MKNPMKHAWRILMAIAVASVAASCSDGELALPTNPNVTVPTPSIVEFYANPTEIKAGETSTISWNVLNADSVEITAVAKDSSPVSFHVQTTELTGSAPAAGLTADTDFTITATKTTTTSTDTGGTAAAPATTKSILTKAGEIQFGTIPPTTAPSGSASPAAPQTATETITVKVNAGLAATIAADKPSIAAGEQTVIRWTVSPADGVTTVVSADSGETFDAKASCPDGADVATIAALPKADPVPAVGCAVVSPTVKTAYTVTGTDASGNKGTASTSVDVAQAKVTATILVSDKTSQPSDHLNVSSFVDPVTVTWTATPAAAKVTVTPDPAAVCQPALPNGVSGAATSASCTISGDTNFKIHAELGGSSADATAVVFLKPSNMAFSIAPQWAFEGETVTLAMTLDPSSNPTQIEDVKIDDASINSPDVVNALKAATPGNTVNIPGVQAVAAGVAVKIVYDGGKETPPVSAVQVVSLNKKDLGVSKSGVKELGLTSVAFGMPASDAADQTIIPYYGAQFDGFNGGLARIYRGEQVSAVDNINFGDKIKSLDGMQALWNDGFFDALKTYPTVVAARTSKPTDVFVGVTGAVMRSKDGGDTWDSILISRRRAAKKSETPDHPTCGRADSGGQAVQKGVQARFDGDFISLTQICDIAARADGRVIVATDYGVQVDESIDVSPVAWKGKPPAGSMGEKEGMLTFGHVVNKLIDVMAYDGTTDMIFAATDAGIFQSTDGGMTWAKFGDQTGPVFALAYDNTILYAGDESGISASPVTAPAFQPVGSINSPVIALAIDPSVPTTILAGTPTGAMITRDRGTTWSPVAQVNGGDQATQTAVKAVGITSHKTQNGAMEYQVGFGTTTGGFYQKFQVSAATPPADNGLTKAFKAPLASRVGAISIIAGQ